MNKFCQSCGMPMSKDPENGGTEKDGSRTDLYCSYCFKDGEFTAPEIKTAKDMQKYCIGIMKEQGTPGWLAWLFTRGVPRLKRWKEK